MQIWKNTFKNISLLSVLLVLVSCSSQQEDVNNASNQEIHSGDIWNENSQTISGKALGTNLIVKTSDDSLFLSVPEAVQFFEEFNGELSTYNPNSLISRFNNNADSVLDLNKTKYFKTCFELSQQIYEKTNGSFDPSAFPLVDLWGFVREIEKIPNQDEVDSVLSFVGFTPNIYYKYQGGVLTKKDKRFRIVFNAIAKGQAVDELVALLEKKGQENYYIEIGGEIYVKGVNDRNTKWIIGIDEPIVSNTGLEQSKPRPVENYIEISNKAMATSGNYRNFYVIDGVEYSHTLSPHTGYPVKKSILSATVISDNVAKSDAYATAFMVIGVDSTMAFIKANPELDLDVYLLFFSDEGRIQRTYNRGMLKYLMDK